MSSFTNASANSGMLRSEICQQSLNELKSSVFDMFNMFCRKNAKWPSVIKRVSNWSDAEVEDEVLALLHQYPEAENNFRYALLKTLKTINMRNGVKDTRIKMSQLNMLSFRDFYRDFVQRIIAGSEFSSQGVFLSLRPSDKEILARDAFRHTLYAHSRDLFGAVVESSSPKQEEVKLDNINEIEPSDSVSQAPSEVISIRPSKDSRLSESILKLHNDTPAPPLAAGSKVSKRSKATRASKQSSYQVIPAAGSTAPKVEVNLFSQLSRQSSKRPEEDVIECDLGTASRATRKSSSSRRPRSHFTRSQRSKVSRIDEAPRFYDDDDGIDVATADVATVV